MKNQLPRPVKTAARAGVKFSVYVVKDFFQKKWPNSEALRILKQARKSYLRYGKVTLLDKYDNKALIYLVRAVYSTKIGTKTTPVEEWLSIRFIPGHGLPRLTEDFTHCLAEGKSLEHVFQKKLFPQNKNFSRYVATLSRLCKIPPGFIGPKIPAQGLLFKKNKYTLYSFCLANQAFLEHEYSRNNFLYLTALFRDEVLKKSLSVSDYGIKSPLLRDGHKVLGLKKPSRIEIKRYPFIYNYPGYFLNTQDTIKFLKRLLKQRHLSNKTLNYYTKYATIPDSVNSRHLGRLFSESGKLKFSALMAKEFRRLAGKEIKDGPKLKISTFKNWGETIKKISESL